MLFEKSRCPGIGPVGRGLIVMLSANSGKSMIIKRIIIEGDQRITVQCGMNPGLNLGWAVFIFAGNVQREGRGQSCRLTEQLIESDTVIADGSVDIGSNRRQKSKFTTKAISDRPDLAG